MLNKAPEIIDEFYLHFLGNLTTTGSVILDGVGLYSIYYGLKIIANEMRSPYFNYDEMLRICEKTKN